MSILSIRNSDFVDEFGRTLMLRGINLAGSSKIPSRPHLPTHIRDGFFNHREVSFVGRPFPLDEADEHFARLKKWGFTFLRFLITWEAIEHAGPGMYDDEYIHYVHAILEKAHSYGIRVFIDPHQDVWSRFTGGDGAPGWTLELAGMDLRYLQETGAAIVHALHGDPFPRMIWPTNAHKLAAATMFALFFAGNDLAPKTFMEGEPAQEFLQRHYIAAMRRLAHALRDQPNVVGFDTMNEPVRGYIGIEDLNECCGRPRLGDFPTPLEAMVLASGIPLEVGVWDFKLSGNRKIASRLINPKGQRLWREGFECIWRSNGVWDIGPTGQPRLLRPFHFHQVNGRTLNFNQDYFQPFANRFAREIREEIPQAIIFIETEPSTPAPHWGKEDAPRIVYAPHWYDAYTLVFKHYSSWVAGDFHTGKPVFTPWAIERSFREQLARFKHEAKEHLGGAPVFIGEFGIPFDLNNRRAFRNGDFSAQSKAMDRSMRAIEANLLSGALWNYTPDNTNQHGDQWNGEDFSIFSRDQQTDPEDIHSGGRALDAVLRPYPVATAGKPVYLRFDRKKKRMEYHFEHDPTINAPTELFIPSFQYPSGIRVEAPAGQTRYFPEDQRLEYSPAEPGGIHRIIIFPA
ncbi:MAG TPA: hypothetical protein DEQ80_02720 [Anaerolinea thermolimosa]|uniref:Glycosyl hydrolase family 35 n=1 Tax=Anaerolinea thermolimosa TaxID=229919 RepID=A0A3D1JE26_9CHLR|nr:cellulase family glycosylhydrolase [Anaerolinea thermolimosa]GAP06194.1 endoglucanase [Anaerolinea thermolimosa]HCE16753.1 hypothetical protein [Anaerolinea thermolimosa]